MAGTVDKLIGEIVDCIFIDDFSVQKQFYLTQSLLALTRLAHQTGYDLGRSETLKKINAAFESASAFDADAIVELAVRKQKRH